jgi:DNA ligase D-like protein (predicted 3'-phosphoesterase)
MSLEQYAKKRNLKLSKEPSPRKQAERKRLTPKKLISHEQKYKGKIKRKKPIRLLRYVIHEHHATHLHWDLRLEMDGVLKSWAVPKSPPENKGTKRLAIQVEDHPLGYASFQGIISEGNYGAGTVKIWDSGDYELLKKYSDKFIIELHGKKLKGKYCLVKTTFRNRKSWLFMKL